MNKLFADTNKGMFSIVLGFAFVLLFGFIGIPLWGFTGVMFTAISLVITALIAACTFVNAEEKNVSVTLTNNVTEVAEALDKLKTMKENGLITEEEYTINRRKYAEKL